VNSSPPGKRVAGVVLLLLACIPELLAAVVVPAVLAERNAF
jgi:hypothetical protein